MAGSTACGGSRAPANHRATTANTAADRGSSHRGAFYKPNCLLRPRYAQRTANGSEIRIIADPSAIIRHGQISKLAVRRYFVAVPRQVESNRASQNNRHSGILASPAGLMVCDCFGPKLLLAFCFAAWLHFRCNHRCTPPDTPTAVALSSAKFTTTIPAANLLEFATIHNPPARQSYLDGTERSTAGSVHTFHVGTVIAARLSGRSGRGRGQPAGAGVMTRLCRAPTTTVTVSSCATAAPGIDRVCVRRGLPEPDGLYRRNDQSTTCHRCRQRRTNAWRTSPPASRMSAHQQPPPFVIAVIPAVAPPR